MGHAIRLILINLRGLPSEPIQTQLITVFGRTRSDALLKYQIPIFKSAIWAK